ncbi:hypothetical protein D9D10_10045 [Raoultella ornithinolytica]|nr:hypothetical protein D9D10_10045 [Raoultella ornithinolytica]
MAPGSLALVTASNRFGDIKNPPHWGGFFCLQPATFARVCRRRFPAAGLLVGREQIATQVGIVYFL